ncbi:REP-associated tyrosine transposase [Pseudoduganella sp. RAF53_2]|jgi:putative transposase|uniref:REP-associated tyrosine transposase n=1 Tax=unclassified Pseudoduganella TaxID=2637179 RepID=UPI003F95A696
MPNYRRLLHPGGRYFFTVVSEGRRRILTDAAFRHNLRFAIQRVRARYPFDIIAFVLLPDHLHTIWTLPEGDSNFPLRWRLIKGLVTHQGGQNSPWQHRYMEHWLRSEEDFRQHFDYLHWNPMKHGLVARVVDWPWSTFHRYIAEGIYTADWCGDAVSGGSMIRPTTPHLE